MLEKDIFYIESPKMASRYFPNKKIHRYSDSIRATAIISKALIFNVFLKKLLYLQPNLKVFCPNRIQITVNIFLI
jgi:hypothetical protein